VDEMIISAETQTRELGKIDDFDSHEAKTLYHQLGLGALKFFLLKVDPKKRMLFDPEESIQFQGHTGPFIQYTHARISAILRKAQMDNLDLSGLKGNAYSDMKAVEMDLCYAVLQLHSKIREAAEHLDPALLANYVFELAKEYNRFYAEMPIFNEEDAHAQQFRLALSKTVAQTIKIIMGLLGIEVPNKM
jgi:arginyl-tRNA synthetase